MKLGKKSKKVFNRNLSDRERRRIATRCKNHGDDFDSRNAFHASNFNDKTKFNSKTGREAALKKWQMVREKKALEAKKRSNEKKD